MLTTCPERRRARPFPPSGGLGLLLALALLAGACSSNAAATRTSLAGVPTSTETPSGDVLRIDGDPVRRVLIPDIAQGPLYELTDDRLYLHEKGRWLPTATANDGRAILVDLSLPERLFRGGQPDCEAGSSVPEPAFEVSEDGGATWAARPAGHGVQPLLLDPDLPEYVYGSDCTLAISTDAGLTWTRLDLMAGYAVADVAVDGTRLYALGLSAEDEDRVRAVDMRDPLIPEPDDLVLSTEGLRSIDAADGRLVAGGVYGVAVSDDGGATWATSRTGLETATRAEATPRTRLATPASSESIGVLVVAIAPESKHRIFAGTSDGLYISQDDGASWDRYDAVAAGVPVLDIQFGLGGADLYVTTPEGVLVVPSP